LVDHVVLVENESYIKDEVSCIDLLFIYNEVEVDLLPDEVGAAPRSRVFEEAMIGHSDLGLACYLRSLSNFLICIYLNFEIGTCRFESKSDNIEVPLI